MINKKVALLTEDHLLFIVFQVLNMVCLFCVNIYSFKKIFWKVSPSMLEYPSIFVKNTLYFFLR